MIFANNRRQAERTADRLNEQLAAEERALSNAEGHSLAAPVAQRQVSDVEAAGKVSGLTGGVNGIKKVLLAMAYSPKGLPPKYHRR